jgi:hypothetical protein
MISVLKDIYKDERYWVYDSNDTSERYNRWGQKLGLSPFLMLNGNDFSIILPRHWETVVHPDYSVTMRFHDWRLNDVPNPRGQQSDTLKIWKGGSRYKMLLKARLFGDKITAE